MIQNVLNVVGTCLLKKNTHNKYTNSKLDWMELSFLVWNFLHEINSPIRSWIMDDRRHDGQVIFVGFIFADFSKKIPKVHSWAQHSSLLLFFFLNVWTLTDRDVVDTHWLFVAVVGYLVSMMDTSLFSGLLNVARERATVHSVC